MVHIALKQWQRALLFLEVVLMTPASNNASLIQVEAYKKYVLIGLLHTGKVSYLFAAVLNIFFVAVLTNPSISPCLGL